MDADVMICLLEYKVKFVENRPILSYLILALQEFRKLKLPY